MSAEEKKSQRLETARNMKENWIKWRELASQEEAEYEEESEEGEIEKGEAAEEPEKRDNKKAKGQY